MSQIISIDLHAELPEPFREEWLRLPALRAEAAACEESAWRPMLEYTARLHEASIRRSPALPYPWEEIGPGYVGGRAFGHWDLIHQTLDTLEPEPGHARRQLLNYFHHQSESGYMPGTIYFADNPNPAMQGAYPCYSARSGHPPVWPFAVEDHFRLAGDEVLLLRALGVAERQVGWFERHRQAQGGGFFYIDIVEGRWESGVDEGARFLHPPATPMACVDATAHVFLLYDAIQRWRTRLGLPDEGARAKASALRTLIRERLYCEEAGLFFDEWAIRRPLAERPFAFEGMWPIVVGAATPEQAARVIADNLLNAERFFTPYPIATVAPADTAHFELRMWRGPAWNSMTYWAARGCAHHGYTEEAATLLGAALHGAAAIFSETGTIWEFYHPFGGHPQELERKPQSGFNTPCRDYLGHNPLLAMARLYRQCREPAVAQTALESFV